jgi:hypothetical protein
MSNTNIFSDIKVAVFSVVNNPVKAVTAAATWGSDMSDWE